MNWLDRYHDDWRNADYPLDIGIDESGSYVDLLQNQEYFDRSPLVTTNKVVPVPAAAAPKVCRITLFISRMSPRNKKKTVT